MTVLSKSLAGHLEEMQHAAYVAESLVSVIVACGADPKRSHLTIEAAERAQQVLAELARGLDTVEISKVTA